MKNEILYKRLFKFLYFVRKIRGLKLEFTKIIDKIIETRTQLILYGSAI